MAKSVKDRIGFRAELPNSLRRVRYGLQRLLVSADPSATSAVYTPRPMATQSAPGDAELQRLDRSAWEQLYRLYGGRLYAFAYRLTGDPYDAADLVHETLVGAVPRLDRFDPDGLDLSAYLFKTARNIYLRREKEADPAEPAEAAPEPAEQPPLE